MKVDAWATNDYLRGAQLEAYMRRFHLTLLFASLTFPLVAQTGASFQLNLNNRSRHTVSSFQVSPTSSPDWGDNLLGQPLTPEQQTTVTVNGACGQYDVRFVAENGTRLHDEAVTFCTGDTITIGDRTLTRTPAPQ